MSVIGAPELTAYQDEPGQMPSGAPGKNGALELCFARRGDRSVLTHLSRTAPLLVQQALYWDEHLPGLPCVYVITTSGCVLQGDRLDVRITVGAGAMAHVTTQSATKVHQMDANYAAQSQRLILADGAYLELLPGPVIPHRHSRFVTRTDATVAASATLLTAEMLLPGRTHHSHGEVFEFDLYSSAFTASRPDGSALVADKLVAEPWRRPVRRAGVMGTFNVLATVIVITPPVRMRAIAQQVVAGFDEDNGCVAGASRLPHDAGLVYRVLGMETEPVKAKVREFWQLVRREVTGARVPAARPWGPPLLPPADAAQPASLCTALCCWPIRTRPRPPDNRISGDRHREIDGVGAWHDSGAFPRQGFGDRSGAGTADPSPPPARRRQDRGNQPGPAVPRSGPAADAKARGHGNARTRRRMAGRE